MRTYIFILLCAFVFIDIFSQDNYFGRQSIPELATPNPDMQALGRYGNIPVNQYTGVANIEVPLYTMDFEGLKIPIGLSYNAGGIRVSQEASWVGLGWALSCEPVITRQINGLCDITEAQDIGASYIVGYAYTDQELPDYGGYISPELNEKIRERYQPLSALMGWDTDPDLFTLNLFGEVVSFVLTQKKLNNGKIGVKLINPDKRFQVEYVENEKSFVVTNGMGFKFYFTEKEYTVLTTQSGDYMGVYYTPYNSSLSMISGWKLSKIIAPNNRIANFNYKKASYSSLPQVVSSIINSANKFYLNMGKFEITVSDYVNCYNSNYLTSITSDFVKINFKSSKRLDISEFAQMPGPRIGVLIGIDLFNKGSRFAVKLDEISIQNIQGDDLGSYKLEYSYFNKNKQNDTFYNLYMRLKLDAVHKNNTKYREFSYRNENNLPRKDFLQKDFWGFMNNRVYMLRNTYAYNNVWGISFPFYKDDYYDIGGMDRRSDTQYMQYGMLSKVIYPTGGYSQLQYEANTIELNKTNLKQFLPYDYIGYKVDSIESESVEYPKETDVFEITEESGLNTILDVTFGIGSDYELKNKASHIKYSVAEKDANNMAYQIVNVSTNKVVLEGVFSVTGETNDRPLGTRDYYLNWNKHKQMIILPKGKYKVVARALKHVSNFYNKDDGFYNTNDPDYDKYYNFSVKLKVSIPLLSFARSVNLPVGGLRIKSISNYDAGGKLLTQKEYKYSSGIENALGEVSSGKLVDGMCFAQNNNYYFVDYGPVRTAQSSPIPMVGYAFPTMLPVLEIFSSSLYRSWSPNHIGYTRIEELSVDVNKPENNGKKVVEFINIENTYEVDFNKASGNAYFTNMYVEFSGCKTMSKVQNPDGGIGFIASEISHHINGRINKENYYDSRNKIVKEVLYNYKYVSPTINISNDRIISKGAIQYSKWLYSDEYNPTSFKRVAATPYVFQIYKIISEDNPLLSMTDVDYFNGVPVSRTTTYKYNDNYLLSTQTESTSTGSDKEIHYRYPIDFKTISPYKEMVAANLIEAIVQKNEKKDKAEYITKVNYVNLSPGNLTNRLFLPSSVQTSSNGLNNLETDIYYNKYSTKGNLLEYKQKDAVNTVYLWSYNGLYPIAEIRNSTYDEIEKLLTKALIERLEQAATPSSTDLQAVNNLRLNSTLRNASITTYTHKSLVGMTSSTDPSGITTYYEYDNIGRLSRTYIKEGNTEKNIQKYGYHYQNQ